MTGFFARSGTLTCDGISLADIAATTGTPTYVYSGAQLADRFAALDRACAAVPHRLHYALKANSTLGVVRALRALGALADANSWGEIEVARRAGYAPHEIVFTGVGKRADELAHAVSLGLGAINAESAGEIERIADLAASGGQVARVAVRVNLDVEAGSHPHISTGSRTTKFGISPPDLQAMLHRIAGHPSLRLVGLHVHIGSQITDAAPIRQAAEGLADLSLDLRRQGFPLEHIDLGGGLGIPYRDGQAVLTPEEYAAALVPAVVRAGLPLVLEPGRWLVGPVGTLVTRVVDLKPKPGGGWFVIVDAGMTDLIRPALYGAWHRIEAVTPRAGDSITVDVVGPVCETADTLGADRQLPPVEVGDLLAVRDAGAYGSVMASNYNKRVTAAEILVEAGEPRLIRRRQTIDDLLQWDL